jgi:flavodoxin
MDKGGFAMATAVVYYSATGNSAIAAKALSEKLGAKLIELKEVKQRDYSKVNGAFMAAGFKAVFGIRSKLLGQPWEDARDCGELRLITPIWAGKPVPAMNTFVSKADFKGKKVYLYTVQADTNDTAKNARDKLGAVLTAKGATVAGEYGLTGAGPGKEPNKELAQKICGL